VSRRAILAFVLVVAGLAGIVVVGRDAPVRPTPVFAAVPPPWIPAVDGPGSLTGTWFCPGVPASGEEGVGGEVIISNRESAQLDGRFVVLADSGVVAEQDFTVGEWSQTTIDVDAFVTTDFASVVVEIDGGRGFVEQRALHPAGTSIAACSNDTSREWYLADGFTLDGSVETLILTNPFDEPVVANLRFSIEGDEREPSLFQGFTVAPRSVTTIPIAELGARDEPIIAVAIDTTFGRLVVGRSQHYTGGGRLGYDISLASPALRDQLWFVDGQRGEGISETYSIYNPTDDDIEVDVVFLGLPIEANFGDVDPIPVPARRVVVFDPYAEPGADGSSDETADGEADVDETGDGDDPFVEFETGGIPEGRHSVVFSTLGAPAIVVERVLTRPTESALSTTVLLGAPPRADSHVAQRWHLGVGPSEPTEQALVVYNVDQVDAEITIEAVGPAGPFVVPGLSSIPLGPGAVRAIDLVDPDVLGQELIVTSTSRVFIERLLPRGTDLDGRSSSWLLPSSN
jgi:hypothetical protein